MSDSQKDYDQQIETMRKCGQELRTELAKAAYKASTWQEKNTILEDRFAVFAQMHTLKGNEDLIAMAQSFKNRTTAIRNQNNTP